MRQPWAPWVWLFAVGCGGGTGTDLDQIANVDPLSDAAAPDASASWRGAWYPDPFQGAPAYMAQMGASSHNPGLACLQSGCHGGTPGPGAPPLFLGGTVYEDYQGTKPAAGVEVRIVDSAGHAASVYAGPQGNFFIPSGAQNGMTFPAAIAARDADTSRPMITLITAAGMGSCGQTSCHVPGGGPTTNTGNYFPIHVP